MKLFAFFVFNMLIGSVLLVSAYHHVPNPEAVLWMGIPYFIFQAYTGLMWVLE